MHACVTILITVVITRCILADAISDYNVASSTDLVFAQCSSEQCADITIIDDDALEPRETFSVILERPPDLDQRIRIIDTEKVVAIIDSDGKN